jgi:transposase
VQQRKEKLEKALAILKRRQSAAKEKPPKDVSVADPEAPWVKKAGRVVRGYSGQVAADSERKIIVGVKATAEPVDFDQLNPMLREIEKTTGRAPDQLVADSGYYTDEAVVEASKSKTDCLVPDSETASQLNNPKRSQGPEAKYQVSQFAYDEDKDEFTCLQGRRLRFVGNHKTHGQVKKVYRCTDCNTCLLQAECAGNRRGFRSVEVSPDHGQVRKLREKVKTEIGRAIYKKRKAIIEPIFGRWHHNWGIRRLRLRGLAGFSIELHLLVIAHNLTKLICFQQGLAHAAAKS